MDDSMKISKMVENQAEKILDPARREVFILKDDRAIEIAARCHSSVGDVYRAALSAEIYPYRYVRNRKILSAQEQLRLAEARVVVVGSGGLGGTVILLLARTGIGNLVVIDYDVFDETNLNRQALSDMESIGKSKSEKAFTLVRSINPGVEIESHRVEIDFSKALALFQGAGVVVDALDNIPDRFILEKAAKKLGVPLVHGAIAGFDGQLMTIFPEDRGLESVYGDGGAEKNDPARPGALLGVPAITPSLVATLQAMEVVKIILNRGDLFRNKLVHIDLESGQFNHFRFEEGS